MPFENKLHGRLSKVIERTVFLANGNEVKPGVFPALMRATVEEEGKQIEVWVPVDNPFVLDECLTLFQDEPNFQYFEPQALEQSLKTLVAQAARQSKQLTKSKAIKGLIDGFYTQLGREVQDYEIAFVLNGPELRQDELTVGASVACTWSRDQAVKWGMKVEAENFDALIDQPLIVLKSRGSSIDVAIELGRRQMESDLDLLRVAIGWGGFVQKIGGTTVVGAQLELPNGGRVYEPELQFAWTRLFVIRPFGKLDDAIVYDYEHRQPEWPSLTDTRLLSSTRSLLTKFNQFINSTGGRCYGREFRRALDWMGSSMTRQRYDDQVVDLCTALECVLTKESDGLKAEALTLRYAVLAKAVGNHYAPLNHLRTSYLIRNTVVHGSEKDVAGAGHVDTLMTAAVFSLLNVLQLAEQVDDAPTTSAALITYLDKQEEILTSINENDLLISASHPQLNKDIHDHYKKLSDAVPGLIKPMKMIRLPAEPDEFAAAVLARSDAQQLIAALMARTQESGLSEGVSLQPSP